MGSSVGYVFVLCLKTADIDKIWSSLWEQLQNCPREKNPVWWQACSLTSSQMALISIPAGGYQYRLSQLLEMAGIRLWGQGLLAECL